VLAKVQGPRTAIRTRFRFRVRVLSGTGYVERKGVIEGGKGGGR
jgi:hypothetical protein